MIEYRKLPHGEEKISTLGLGMGSMQNSGDEEIFSVIQKAIQSGINYFDLCCGGAHVFQPFGEAMKGNRNNIYLQMHFGAVYNKKGDYGWSRDLNKIKKTVDWELKTLQTDYIDFGFLHCIDDFEDLEDMRSCGVIDYVQQLKRQGVVKHIAFSSHTPAVAEKILDMGIVDLFMFSINPAYDFEKGDEYGKGTANERAHLFQRAQKEGVAISVMKPFLAGMLLDQKTSPFKVALTKYQCLQYALDRPAVICALPGIRNGKDLEELLGFLHATKEEKDYSAIASFTPEKVVGSCVYCNHCQPCPKGIDIGLVNKYYDLSKIGDVLATDHYKKLQINAEACIACGHCDERCPFKVMQSARMKEIGEYFKTK